MNIRLPSYGKLIVGVVAVQEAGWCEYLSQMQFDALNRGWYHNYQGEFPSIHTLSLSAAHCWCGDWWCADLW